MRKEGDNFIIMENNTFGCMLFMEYVGEIEANFTSIKWRNKKWYSIKFSENNFTLWFCSKSIRNRCFNYIKNNS